MAKRLSGSARKPVKRTGRPPKNEAGKLAAKKKGEKNKPAAKEHATTDPKYILFFVELALNGNKIKPAAEAVGLSYQYAKQVAAGHPDLRNEAIARVKAATEKGKMRLAGLATEAGEEQIEGWAAMHQKALRKVNALIDSKDDRVALGASELVIERVEGKVQQKIQIEDDSGVSLATVTMRFVAALMMHQGLTMASAMSYAQEHPEKVEEWGRLNARDALPPGGGSQ